MSIRKLGRLAAALAVACAAVLPVTAATDPAVEPGPIPDHPDWGYVVACVQGGKTYRAFVYTNTVENMSFVVPSDVTALEYLVVAGGGSGASRDSAELGGGGGGGGGVLSATASVAPGQTFDVKVGAGAEGVTGRNNGKQGGNSSLTCEEASVTVEAIGGGAGGQYGNVGGSGGSGGGGGGRNGGDAKASDGGKGTAGQGYGGGYGWDFASGGGGGAGGLGGNASSLHDGGDGGVGFESAITGTTRFYGAGGAGAGSSKNNVVGADGQAAEDGAGVGENGADGLGAGGGGQIVSSKTAASGAGGSGTVILRYEVAGGGDKPIYNLPEVPETSAYTGAVQKPAIAENEGYTVLWTGDWTHVGEHTLTMTLTDPEGSLWGDGTTDQKHYVCTITRATNTWTVEPILSTQWEVGTTPDVTLGTPAFGEVVMTPDDLASLPLGAATVTFAVAGTDDYTELTKAVNVFIVPQGLGPTGNPDAVPTTYTWMNDSESCLWFDSNCWSSDVQPCFGFPANSFATAVFGASDEPVVVSGNANTYSLAALKAGCDLTLKGGAFETAALTSAGSRLVLDGASVENTALFEQKIAGFAFVLVNGATYRQTANRIRLNAQNQVIAVTNSTFESYFDLRTANETATFKDSTVKFSTFEMNAGNQSVEIDGGSVTLSGNVSVNGAGQTLALKDVALDVSGQFNIGFNQSGSVATADAEVVLDNAEIHQKGNVTRIGSTSVKAALTFRGVKPKYVQEANNQYVQTGTSKGEARPGGADFRFELPASPYESAPLQMTSAKSAQHFYGNTCLVVDDAGADRSVAAVYPLVSSAEAFSWGAADAGDTAAFFNLIKASATLPLGAELVLSDDNKTISVSLAAIRNVVFQDDDGAILLATQQVVSGSCAVAPESVPFHSGYVFDGWTPDGGVTKYSNAEVAKVTITADTAFVATYKADAKTAVEVPTVAEGAVYTGEENKPSVPENEGYTIDWGATDWTQVGVHTVTLTLKDTEKYIWADGESEPKAFAFTITQAANAWTTEPTVATSWTEGETPAFGLGTATFGTVVMTPAGLSALKVGAYTVKFAVAETANYTGLEKTVAVRVRPQGLGPTGDPDTEDAPRVYTWKGEDATGYWYDSNRWTPDETPAFGYPANAFASAVFTSAVCTVTGEADDTVYALGGLTVKDSKVTLTGGAYEPNALTLAGTAPALALTDGAKLMLGTEFQLQNQTDVTIAVTNATLGGEISVRNGAKNFCGSFHNATFNGRLAMAHAGETKEDSNQIVMFSGVESKLNFEAGTAFANQGIDVRFEHGVSVTFTAGGGKAVTVGKNSTLTFAGDNVVNYSSYMYGQGDGATIFFGAGSVMTNGVGYCDFGLYRTMSGLSNVRTVISNATITAGNQVYMPHPDKANKSGCGVTFLGDCPRVNVGNTQVYIGKEALAEDEVLPSWRFVLPATPYEVAPMVVNATAANTKFCSNTPIEIDVSAVKFRGRYPLFTFANAPEVDIDMLTAAMTAYKVRHVARKDARERVTLGWDAETKTIYADVTDAPGFMISVR